MTAHLDFDPLNPETDRKIVRAMLATIVAVTVISAAVNFWPSPKMGFSYPMPSNASFHMDDCNAIGGAVHEGVCTRVLD